MPQSNPGSTHSLAQWAAAIAAPTPAPGGGAAAATTLALASALVEMVAGLTARRERYAAVHDRCRTAAERATVLRGESLQLALADAAAFSGFERALALPRDTEARRAERERAKAAAYRDGALVQHQVLIRTEETARLALALTGDGLKSAAGDALTGLFLAAAAARSAEAAVRVNLDGVDDDEGRRIRAESATILQRVEAMEHRARAGSEGAPE